MQEGLRGGEDGSLRARHESASRHLLTHVPTARAEESAGVVLDRLRRSERPYDAVDSIYVLDGEGRLEGDVVWTRLLAAEPGRTMSSLMRPDPPRVGPDSDQEHTAFVALRTRAAEIPVVAGDGTLLGVVPPLALLDILHREHIEDLHRLAGIVREGGIVRGAIESPPSRGARHRLPWLLIGLLGSLLAAFVMSRYESVLAAHLAVSFFVPTIVYLADAIGTQTEAIVVRGLSISRQPLRKLLIAELGTGVLIGGTLGSLAVPLIGFAFGDFRLALSVGLAVLVAGAAATSIGLLLPWLLQRAGQDPAFGSGPLATVIQDVLSLVIYFAIASALVLP